MKHYDVRVRHNEETAVRSGKSQGFDRQTLYYLDIIGGDGGGVSSTELASWSADVTRRTASLMSTSNLPSNQHLHNNTNAIASSQSFVTSITPDNHDSRATSPLGQMHPEGVVNNGQDMGVVSPLMQSVGSTPLWTSGN
eukprot:TRINITY_DN5555_c0_g1::TRINITY_DN5555_c0_g1_i1::g.9335::m.9335 TRINITY_DN5555_c0_g1::TRINITY_DN5555_c0_g1_i1::g.9335  ORF type:complete len:139 (+),score=8.73 TRINITY_DN5555_c0_g1_i1:265-681(+)